jgi:hypothetical protein
LVISAFSHLDGKKLRKSMILTDINIQNFLPNVKLNRLEKAKRPKVQSHPVLLRTSTGSSLQFYISNTKLMQNAKLLTKKLSSENLFINLISS